MRSYVYAGVSARTGGTISGLFRRATDQAQWTHATSGMPDDTHVHAITVHPDVPATVFAAPGAGLLAIDVRSTMMAVALHDQDRVHCVTRGGQTFSPLDGGRGWQEIPLPDGAGAAVAVACG